MKLKKNKRSRKRVHNLLAHTHNTIDNKIILNIFIDGMTANMRKNN